MTNPVITRRYLVWCYAKDAPHIKWHLCSGSTWGMSKYTWCGYEADTTSYLDAVSYGATSFPVLTWPNELPFCPSCVARFEADLYYAMCHPDGTLCQFMYGEHDCPGGRHDIPT